VFCQVPSRVNCYGVHCGSRSGDIGPVLLGCGGCSAKEEAERSITRGALSRLDLTMPAPEQSMPFYNGILPWRGYRRVLVEPSTTAVACWSIADADQSVCSLALEAARGAGRRRKYDRLRGCACVVYGDNVQLLLVKGERGIHSTPSRNEGR
jgi:hypothetical protein